MFIMTSYGYFRIRKEMVDYKSRLHDKFKLQLEQIGVKSNKISWDVGEYSEELPVFKNLIKTILKADDILYIPKLSHIGKSLQEFLKIQEDLKYRKILCIVLELPSPEDIKFQTQLQEALSLLSQKEAEQRIRRQKRGIEEARDKGLLGPKTKITPEQVRQIYELKKQNKTAAEISLVIGYSIATIYRVLSKQYRYPVPSEDQADNV